MILTGENQNTQGKPVPLPLLSSINPAWTGLGTDPDLRGDWPATNHLSHGMNRDWFNICINSTGHGTG